jgi:hypothetical protein
MVEHFQNPTIEHFSFGDLFSFGGGSSKKATPPLERTRPTYSDSDSSPPQFSTLNYGPNGPNSYEQKNQNALPNYDKSGELELEKAILELKGNSGDYKKDVAVAPQRIQPAPVKPNVPTISPADLQKAIIPTVESPPAPMPKAPSMNCKFLNSQKCHPDYPNFSGASLNFGGEKNKVKCDSVGGEKMAKAICTIADGSITGAYILDEGSGYEVAPKVVVEGGGGSGCKLESEVIDGKVKKIIVKAKGQGFTGTPSIKIESPNMSNGCYLCCK